MLDVQTIENILTFLGRTTLQGNEVPAFVQASNALQQARAEQISAALPTQAPAPAKPQKAK